MATDSLTQNNYTWYPEASYLREINQKIDELNILTSRNIYDAFGRLRVSDPYTLFDSKQLGDQRLLFWEEFDDGTGTIDFTYDSTTSSTTIDLADAANLVGERGIRRTYQRFNYQPGKSLLIFLTGVMSLQQDEEIKRIGYFDDNDGIFFELNQNGLHVGIRNNGTDTLTHQDDWNIDTLASDGSGTTGTKLDISAVQIFFFDMEWLGVGTVRFGFAINGALYYVHQNNHANISPNLDVYMRTANLPLSYEIVSGGTGANEVGAYIKPICSSVISEGGIEATGITRAGSTSGTHVDANATTSVYACVGIRLKSTHLDNIVRPIYMSMMSKTNDNFEWSLYLNPTVAGTFTYNAQTNSAVELALGATANTVTNGTLLQAGFSTSSAAAGTIVNNLRYIGSSVAGARDTIVLCVKPMSSNADIEAALTWIEYA